MEFTLTRSQARQFIVLWQGLSGPYRWRTNAEIVGLVHQLGCLQFDPIDICWIVGIGDLENIHYSRVSSAPMNL